MAKALVAKCVFCFIVAVLVLVVWMPQNGQAQVTTTATLTGTVVDAQDAVIPGAEVVAKNLGTGVEYKTTTSAIGEYQLLNLPPGSYSMSAGAQGFKTAATGTFTLTVNQSSTQNFKLAVGQVTQTVEVTGAAPLMKTGSSNTSTIMDTRKVENLPLNGRQFTELMLLTPGVSPVQQQQDSNPGIGSDRSQLSHSPANPPVDGRPSRDNLYFVDGIIDSEPFFTGFAVAPSIDIIQEFNLETNDDKAAVGLATGGIVNVASKSGTNRFHGSVFEFNRNKAVEARNFFDPSQRPNFNQNQFGATLGGPVPKVKSTWFYAGYEGFRFTQGSALLSRVWNPDERQGDFSKWLTDNPNSGPLGTDALGRQVLAYQLFDPATTRQTVAGQVDTLTGLVATKTGWVREPFTGNIIPAGRFNNNLLLNYLDWIPQPNYPGTPGTGEPNFINTQSAVLALDTESGRMDHRFGANDLIYGRILMNHTWNFTPQSLPDSPTVGLRDTWNTGMHWVHTFSPSVVMDLVAGYAGYENPSAIQQPADKAQMFQRVGFAASGTSWIFGGPGGNVPQMPTIGTGFGSISASAGSDISRMTQLGGDITKIVGQHTFKAGVIWFHDHQVLPGGGCPSVGFGSTQTNDPSNASLTGLGAASFLLNDPSGALVYAGSLPFIVNMNIYGFYGQDTFRITPKFTFNYGLRWDHTTPPAEEHNLISYFDMDSGWYELAGSTPPPACSATQFAPCIPGGTLPANVRMSGMSAEFKPTYDNFQPRLGFAYQLNNKTVIRWGAGTNFDNWADYIQNGVSMRSYWPFGLTQGTSSDLNQYVQTVDAQHVVGPVGATPALTPFPAGSRINSTKYRNAYVTRWNLDVERLLTNTLTLDVGYVGNKGSRTPTGFNQNIALTPGPGPIINRVPWPLAIIGAHGTRTIGSSWYEALQVKLNQRFSHGLDYLVAFTWSKAEDTGCSGFEGIEGCNIAQPNNILSSKSVSSYDVPFILSTSMVYELPFGNGKQFLNQQGIASALTGGWQANAIFRAYSGQPVTLLAGGDFANIGNGGQETPDQILGMPTTPANRTRLQWFNPQAFAFPPDCRLTTTTDCRMGTMGRNTLRGPGFYDIDFSLFRNFPISERFGSLQIRGEFFNLTNHTNFLMGGFNSGLSLNSTPFAEINSAAPSRQIQFAAKWIF
jgi:Carboxypeptidase regulatory-like domain